MTLNPRFYRLTQLHRHLDDLLRLETRAKANPLRLLRLKVLKLAVRTRLAHLSHGAAITL